MHAVLEFWRTGQTPVNPEPVELQGGTPSQEFDIAVKGTQILTLAVETPGLRYCRTRADNGDADLLITKVEDRFTVCNSAGFNSYEGCIFSASVGSYTLAINAFVTVLGVDLACDLVTPTGVTTIRSGITENDLSVGFKQLRAFAVDTDLSLGGTGDDHPLDPYGRLVCSTFAGSSSADLLMGTTSDPAEATCISATGDSSNETCSVPVNSLPELYLWVYADEAMVDLSLDCDIKPLEGVPEAQNGIPLGPISMEVGVDYLFWVNVPTTGTVTCTTSSDGPIDDVDLYMSFNRIVTSYEENDCLSRSYTSSEQCTIGPDLGVVFVTLYAFEVVPTNVQLTCVVST